MIYSPETKLFYVPANEWGMEIWNEPVTYKKGAAYLGAGFTIKTLSDGRLEKGMPSWSANPQVMSNMDALYAYLKGRSDGKITTAKVTGIE